MARPIRILVADDRASLRSAIVRLLATQDGFEVVGEAEDGAKAVELARRLQPDVIIMDYHMPEMDGDRATRRIVCEHPTIRIIGHSLCSKSSENLMLEAGAVAFVPKGTPGSALLDLIRQVGADAQDK